MSADQRRLFERQMETFAGFAAHTDHEVGRLMAQLKENAFVNVGYTLPPSREGG